MRWSAVKVGEVFWDKEEPDEIWLLLNDNGQCVCLSDMSQSSIGRQMDRSTDEAYKSWEIL